MSDGQSVPDKQILAESARLANQLWKWTAVGIAGLVLALLLVGLMAKEKTVIPETAVVTILGLWLTAISALKGIGHLSFANFRVSDYGAMERQAQIEAAKARAPAPQQTTVGAGAVVVQPAAQSQTQVNADAPAPAARSSQPLPRPSGTHDPGA